MGADAEGIEAQEVTDQVACSSHHRIAMQVSLMPVIQHKNYKQSLDQASVYLHTTF